MTLERFCSAHFIHHTYSKKVKKEINSAKFIVMSGRSEFVRTSFVWRGLFRIFFSG